MSNEGTSVGFDKIYLITVVKGKHQSWNVRATPVTIEQYVDYAFNDNLSDYFKNNQIGLIGSTTIDNAIEAFKETAQYTNNFAPKVKSQNNPQPTA
jgi:uncharacterized protein YqkB